MSLVVRVVALRNSKEVGLEKTQHAVKVVMVERRVHPSDRGDTFLPTCLYIVGKEALHQTDADFPVRNVKGVEAGEAVIAFYGEIAALIQQRSDGFHVLGWCVKSRSHCHGWLKHRRHDIELTQLLNQESRGAALKPVAVQHLVLQGVEQAERIEDVGRRPREMITVVLLLQL